MKFTKPKKVIGLDIGSQSVKAVQVVRTGRGMNIEQIGYAQIDRNMLNSDPVATHTKAIREAIAGFNVSQSMIVGSLPGQSVVIRYPRLNNTPISKLGEAVKREKSKSVPYDLSEVLMDWSLLDEEGDGDTKQLRVLLVAAKHDVINQRIQHADIAELQFSTLTVDSLAIADAAEACQLTNDNETVALIDIGATSVGIHFTKNGTSNFIRDISWGSKELIQAIAKHNRMDFEEAETLLLTEAESLSKQSVMDDVVEVSPVDEPDTDLSDNDLGLEMAMPQSNSSSLIGGGSSPEETLVDILATPISRLVTEVRRSFDYYEHQLYEHPVDRIILCGGAANIPLIRESLSEELGIEEVVIADPTAGSVTMNKRLSMDRGSVRSTQYMVAVGLAARGCQNETEHRNNNINLLPKDDENRNLYIAPKLNNNIMDGLTDMTAEHITARLANNFEITDEALKGIRVDPESTPNGPYKAKDVIEIIADWNENDQYGYIERLLTISPMDFSEPVRKVRTYLTKETLLTEERDELLNCCYDIKDILNDEDYVANPVTHYSMTKRMMGF